jgi:phosphoglycerate dehydrogenase-like enzyme
VRALVTAEFTDDGVRRLEGLGLAGHPGRLGLDATGAGHRRARPGAAGADVLVTEIEVVDAEVLTALPGLRLVATARGGPVNVDLAACADRSIPVVFTPARNADSVADFVLGLLLSVSRRIAASERHLRSQGWHVGGELPYLTSADGSWPA